MASIDIDARESERRVYELLMSEVKARLFGIRELMVRCHGLHPQIVHETCNLQLRICCECIALACLAAHGSIPETKRKVLQKAYQPGAIMAELEALHPGFYPVPRWVAPVDHGWHMETTEEEAASFLTRDALVSLWNDLGSKLHKGSMKAIVSGKMSIASEYPDLETHLSSLEVLLRCHTIHSLDFNHVFICEGFLDEPDVGVSCSLVVASKLLVK